jgi:hypothetical protein
MKDLRAKDQLIAEDPILVIISNNLLAHCICWRLDKQTSATNCCSHRSWILSFMRCRVVEEVVRLCSSSQWSQGGWMTGAKHAKGNQCHLAMQNSVFDIPCKTLTICKHYITAKVCQQHLWRCQSSRKLWSCENFLDSGKQDLWRWLIKSSRKLRLCENFLETSINNGPVRYFCSKMYYAADINLWWWCKW